MRPVLEPIDWWVIGLYLLATLVTGSLFARAAGKSLESFFVGDRKLSWWVAGTSMVATTFAADTPLVVTGLTALDGVAGNWIWWSFAIAHLVSTFFFARLWRRSEVITDAEITELRYSGKPAAVLRGVKAVYFGLFVNGLTMAWVIAAMVKITRAFFPVEPLAVVAACALVSVAYTVVGGFRSVVVTDFFQFALGLVGAIALAVVVVGQLGGLGTADGEGLLPALEAAVAAEGDRGMDDVLGFLPPPDHPTLPLVYFVVLLVAGWWRYAEGTGYLVQRFAACRDEANAQGASLWFAVAHNALRPWPWILVGLASLVIYPRLPGPPPPRLEATLAGRQVVVEPARLDVALGGRLELAGLPAGCTASLGGQQVALVAAGPGRHTASFAGFESSGKLDLGLACPGGVAAVVPGLRVELTDREMAYPLLLGRMLPAGLLGLVVASLLAAFMSTVDTHMNWGASYVVQDLYKRFIRKSAPPEHYVRASRVAIVAMALVAAGSALFIDNIASVWRFLIALGAGLGSVTAARWYWPRVTPWAEFAALGMTTLLALGLELVGSPTFFGAANPLFLFPIAAWAKIVLIAGGSLAAWVPVALLGPRNPPETLHRFAAKVRPPGPAWAPYRNAPADALGPMALRFAAGLVVIFASLFGLGDLLLGNPLAGLAQLVAAGACLVWVVRRPA